ncbi:hypothetical protein [Mammaliicoccus phage vB_MscM-PMS3]|nr:hypothetical protein [Mammaliicoccus phage vB_MscM-PMS3]
MTNVLTNQEIEQLLKDNEYSEQEIANARVFKNNGKHLAIDLSQGQYIDLVGFVYYGVWTNTLDDTGNVIETDDTKLEKLVNKNLAIVEKYMEKNELI